METQINEIWTLLEEVKDPEIPVLSVVDLGVVRSIEQKEDQSWKVVITPTYSGCPAMNTIEMEIRILLESSGYKPLTVKTVLSPAWTTKWLSEKGKAQLKAYGIAPPVEDTSDKAALFPEPKVIACPHCGSEDTRMVSQFGSTACKSLYQCNSCLEPFDYFKCH